VAPRCSRCFACEAGRLVCICVCFYLGKHESKYANSAAQEVRDVLNGPVDHVLGRLPPSQTLPRPGEDAVCLALLDQAYPLRTAHHLARKHPVRFVMLVVYAAGLLFIFLMRRQD
jgi:hypothetical protein